MTERNITAIGVRCDSNVQLFHNKSLYPKALFGHVCQAIKKKQKVQKFKKARQFKNQL